MTPKKAAKKTAKKAAKKAAGRHAHNSAHDARRTFEHLGRVQALATFTSSESESLNILTLAADAAYRSQLYQQSADLLRTAEHLSFASLHASVSEAVAHDLKAVIQEEVSHLLARAAERSAHHGTPSPLLPLFQRMQKSAGSAMRRGSCRAALEFARGAEALSHVHELGENSLPAPAATALLRK